MSLPALSDASRIADALSRVGLLLEAEGEAIGIVVIGGAALNLLGIVSRPTVDVNVVAFGDPDHLTEPPEPLPAALTRAVRDVAVRFSMPTDWLNAMAALQWKQGFPPGFAARIVWRQYAGLAVGLASREDLIFFKLYAAADHASTTSNHFKDLLALEPTRRELNVAADWVRTQDPSPGFADLLNAALRHARSRIG